MSEKPSVLVLGGGPDAEREISLASASRVASALRRAGHEVNEESIGTLDADGLAGLGGEVVWPVLHGPWGEGGSMQDLLERGGRPFVGSGARAARLAMDKMGTKLAAASLGIATPPAAVLRPGDEAAPMATPMVVKPVHDGSSFGLALCHEDMDWPRARAAIDPARAWMCERLVGGRELTVGVLDGRALPVVEVRPASGVYDFEAKYERDDTVYTVAPDLPANVGEAMQNHASRLCDAIGVRHLARVDFMLEGTTTWLLELNTMPGFTDHSLVPMAARQEGLDFTALCAKLVSIALRDGTSG